MKLVWCASLGASIVASLIDALPNVMHASPMEYSGQNKDGSRTPRIRLFGSGEAGGYLDTFEATVDGYTVSMIDNDYMYMEFDEKNGKMVSSGLVAGKDDPSTTKSKTSGKKIGKYEHNKVKKRQGVNKEYSESFDSKNRRSKRNSG